MPGQTYLMRVGEDRIVRRGTQLLVCSKVDMEEWQIQQTRKTAIYIDDEAWCLVEKRYVAANEVRYLLDPWPENSHQIPGRRIRYDEAYVRARNETLRKKRIENGAGPVLYHLRAVVGLLPSGIKSMIEANFGVPVRNATFLSIILELMVFFMLGAMLLIFVVGAMLHPLLVFSVPIFIVLIVSISLDLVMRYHSYVREDASPWGLFEWVVGWIMGAKNLLSVGTRKRKNSKTQKC
jgi:hypothetical protein